MSCGANTKDKQGDDSNQTDPAIGSGGGLANGSDDAEALPDASGIRLTAITQSDATATFLAEKSSEGKCDDLSQLGIFSLPLGAACTLGPVAGKILYGETPDRNEDGKISCKDYVSGAKDNGILSAMLCEEEVLRHRQIETIRFTEHRDADQGTIGISFADYDASDAVHAVGTWTGRGPASGRYPANIRVWASQQDSSQDPELHGAFAMSLSSHRAGSVVFDATPFGQEFRGNLEFSAVNDTKRCATAPSRETCHFEDILVHTTENSTPAMSVPAMRMRIYANDKKRLTFLAMEGKIRLTEKSAALWFSKPEDTDALRSVREIYFRTVLKDKQLWGSFDFKDAAGKTVASYITDAAGNPINLTKLIRDGVAGVDYGGICQNVGDKDISECTKIRAADYASLWIGDAALTGTDPGYVIPVSFAGAPTQDGVVVKPQP